MLNHDRRVLSQRWEAAIERAFQRFGGGNPTEAPPRPQRTPYEAENRPPPRPAQASEGQEAETEEELQVWYDCLEALRALGVGETEAKRMMRSVPKPWPQDAGAMVAEAMKRRR
jgi:hypothetical protein